MTIESASRAPELTRRRILVRRVIEAMLPVALLALFAIIDFPLCPTRFFLGIPCPGCGLTRATIAMLSLDVHAMLHFHPLAPIVTPIVGWFFARPVLDELGITTKGRVYVRSPQWVWGTVVAAFLVLYVARFAGLLGGLPDPIDPASSAIGRVYVAMTRF